jgi:ABC-2 type transport system permease protein
MQIVRDPGSIAIAFVMPIFLLMRSGYGLSLDADHVPIALVTAAPSRDSADFIASLQGSHYFALRILPSVAEAEQPLRSGEVEGIAHLQGDCSRRLAVPAPGVPRTGRAPCPARASS